MPASAAALSADDAALCDERLRHPAEVRGNVADAAHVMAEGVHATSAEYGGVDDFF